MVNGKVDSALVGTYVFLMSEALAASTLPSYGSHESAYLQFYDGRGIAPLPLTDLGLCGFICHYASIF